MTRRLTTRSLPRCLFVPVLVLIALLCAGCQGGSHSTNPASARRARLLATTFAHAYLTAANQRDALDRIRPLVKPNLREVAAEEYSSIYGHYHDHVVAGPRSGSNAALAGS